MPVTTALSPTSLAAGFNDGGKGQTTKDVENALLNLRTRSTEAAAAIAALEAGGANPLIETPSTIAVGDDDSAASNGTALFVVPNAIMPLASFESTTAGDADSRFATATGAIANVNDSDSPGGSQVYFDEDGAAADGRLLHANSNAPYDMLVPVSDGRAIKVAYSASAASLGVAVYFDDDAGDPADGLLFVSPTNADGSLTTSANRAIVAAV